MIDIGLISLIVCGSVFGDNQLIRSGITGGSPGLAEHHNAQKYKIQKYYIKRIQNKLIKGGNPPVSKCSSLQLSPHQCIGEEKIALKGPKKLHGVRGHLT